MIEKNIRIGIDTLFESIGSGTGGLVYLRNIIRAISKQLAGEKLYLFTSRMNVEAFRGLKSSNICVIRSGWSNDQPLLRILSQQIIMPYLARKLSLDILLCPGNTVPLVTDVPKVLVVQNRLQYALPREHGRLRRSYRRAFGKIALARAAQIIVPSSEMREYLVEKLKVSRDRVSVIHEGVDRSVFVSQQSWRDGCSQGKALYLLTVATLWPYKNHEIVLRAFARCRREYGLSERLKIVGPDWGGRRQHLMRFASDLGIGGAVDFLGYVPYEKMPSIYAGAAVLLYPSFTESFGLPIVEAMACGVPVIASNRCSLPEVVGDAGICLDPLDEEGWAKAMYSVMTGRDLGNRMRERGLIRAQQFSWDVAGQKILQILRQVAQENRTS